MGDKTQFNPVKAMQFLEKAIAKREAPDLEKLFATMETPDEAKARIEGR